jgi:hypothetical protein
MRREFHVRFCERLKGRFLWSTRLYMRIQEEQGACERIHEEDDDVSGE